MHVVGGEPGTQLAVLGLSERPMAESKLRQIETAAPDLKVAGAKITRLLQRQFPPDSSGQQRSLEGTVETVFSPLSPKFESVLESHFTSYTILLVPHR